MSPCYKCDARSADCHAICEAYKKFVVDNEKEREHIYRERTKYDDIKEFRSIQVHRFYRKHGLKQY